MRKKNANLCVLLIAAILFNGCATTLKKSPLFDSTIGKVKTIAVMPPDVEVFQLTAGGVRELIDEWTESSKELTREALKEHLGKRFGFEIKFVSEEWLKANHRELWKFNQALYNAVSTCALLHAYPGPNAFRYKLTNFDYTLGEEVKELTKACDADALLFVYGFDHEATAGRTALLFWNLLVGAALGTTYIPLNPSMMTIGLVDAQSGDVTWFKISPPGQEYSFRNKSHVNSLVEWLTRDFIASPK